MVRAAADGRRRPDRPREGPGRSRGRGPRLGRALLLLADPGLIGDAGFQLSTLATAGLIAWATPSRRLAGSAVAGCPRWLAECLGVSLAAQAATLPIVLASFGRLALISPLVNLVVVPLVAPAMAAGLVALSAGRSSLVGRAGVVGAIPAAPAWVVLRIIVVVVEARQPAVRERHARPAVDVAAAVVAAGLRRSASPVVAGPARPGRAPNGGRAGAGGPAPTTARPASRGAAAAGRARSALALVVAVPSPWRRRGRPAGIARITVLDVGQGDAILVEGARGGRLLVDGGPDPTRCSSPSTPTSRRGTAGSTP